MESDKLVKHNIIAQMKVDETSEQPFNRKVGGCKDRNQETAPCQRPTTTRRELISEEMK